MPRVTRFAAPGAALSQPLDGLQPLAARGGVRGYPGDETVFVFTPNAGDTLCPFQIHSQQHGPATEWQARRLVCGAGAEGKLFAVAHQIACPATNPEKA